MKGSAALAAAFFFLAPLFGAAAGEGEEGVRVSSQVSTKASLYSQVAAPFSVSTGGAAGLEFLLEGFGEKSSFRAGARLSLLQGNEAAALWRSLGLPGARNDYLLMTPDFDPGASGPPSAIMALALEELALRGYGGPFSFEAGLSQVNWGAGRAFSPADYFTDIDYSSGTVSRRPALIVKATWYPGPVSSLELVLTPYSRLGKALALRGYSTIFDTATIAVSAGLKEAPGSSVGLFLGAVEFSIDLPYVSPYGEGTVTLDPENGWKQEYSAMVGAETRIADLSLMGEYLFSPQGAAEHSVYAALAWKIDEWFSLAIPLLYVPSQENLSIGASLAASGSGSMQYEAGLSCEKKSGSDWFLGLVVQAALVL
jgi:hypothetical protein